MSTPCVTVFRDQQHTYATMYRHCDGYPTGHGAELKELLIRCTSLSGMGYRQPADGRVSLSDAGGTFTANGIGCLAAQVVVHFKNVPGDVYLEPADYSGFVAYQYIVYALNDGGIGLKVRSRTTDPDDAGEGDQGQWMDLFDGPVAEFDPEEAEEYSLFENDEQHFP